VIKAQPAAPQGAAGFLFVAIDRAATFQTHEIWRIARIAADIRTCGDFPQFNRRSRQDADPNAQDVHLYS